MMTSINVHGCRDVHVDRYSHSVNALVFAFTDEANDRHETTAYGIKPANAIRMMAALGTPETYIYYKDKTFTLDKYIEELGVQEVLDKMEEGDGKNIPF